MGKTSPYTWHDQSAKRLRKLERDAPNKIPPYTCPGLDQSIKQINTLTNQLEKIRKQNEKLRNAAEYWKQMAEDLCDEIFQ